MVPRLLMEKCTNTPHQLPEETLHHWEYKPPVTTANRWVTSHGGSPTIYHWGGVGVYTPPLTTANRWVTTYRGPPIIYHWGDTSTQ